MLVIFTLLFMLVAICRGTNPCHSDCVPYRCHGPTQYNCEQCSGNTVLEVDTCVCREGWFTITTKCDTYVANCKTIEVSNGVVNCLECLSARDSLVGNACVRSPLPFFLRSSSAGYTASATDKTDATFFVANNCKSLNAAGKCLECYSGGTVNGAGSCAYVASNCLKQDASGSCVKARIYNYIVKKNPDTFAQCYGACKTCFGGTYGSCLSCPENFYFVPNANAPGGDCLLCNPACTTCYGPLATDCSSVDLASFIERSDPATMNTVKACPANCDWCSSANNCLFCKTKYISMDGLCSTTSNTIPNCLYQYRYTGNSTDICLKYLSSFLTATDGKGYTVTGSVATIQCRRYNFYEGKTITECAECGANYLNMNGLCVAGSLSSISSCSKIVSTSATARICLSCLMGFALVQSRLACQIACTGASETAVMVDGVTSCSPCPAHCTTCTFVTPNLQCTLCDAGYALYKGVCLSTSCGDGEITLNKECDPLLNPTTCTIDCLALDPLACISVNSCTREIFQLVSVATNTLELSLLPRFADKVAFGPQIGTVFDSSHPSALRLICSRLLVDLTDPAAQCIFSPSQLTVSVQVSPGTMRYFSTLSSTTLAPVAVWVARRALTQLAFTVAPRVTVSVDPHHIEKPALITTPPVAPANQDLQLTYELLDPAVCVTTAVFTVTSATINGVDQPQKITDSNSDLSAPLTGKFFIQGSRLSTELSITQQLLLTFCDGTTSVLTSETLVSTVSQKTFKLKDGVRVVRYAAERLVELWFELLVGTFTDADWIIKIAGTNVAASRLIKTAYQVPGIFVLQYIPEAAASGYWLEVGYPNSVSEFIRFEKEVPNLFPSFIVPTKAQIGLSIQFWTSFGPEMTFKTVCMSKVSDTSYFSTVEKQSSFANNLEQSVSVTDSVSLFLIITSQNPVQILRFDIDIVNTMPQPVNTMRSFWELPLTLMYRDGSTMHSSKSPLALGFPSTNWISSIPVLPSPSLTTSSSSGQSTTTPTLSSAGNRLTTTLPSLSPQQTTPTTASLTAAYNSGTTPYTQQLLVRFAVYEQTHLQTKELTVYSGVSPIRVLVVAEIESLPIRPEKTAVILPIGVVSAAGAPAAGLFVPLQAVLPIGRAYAALEVARVILEAVQPFGQVSVGLEYFDGNALVQTVQKVLGVQAPRTGVSLTDAVDGWSQSLTGIFSSLADFELVRSLAFEAHQLNQISARCRFAPGCPAVLNTTLATLRWDILTKFKDYWTAIADKSPWLTWENSVLKSSLMNSLGYDSTQATDAQITWYWQETLRESQNVIDFTSQKRNSASRLSFTLGENLKSLGTLTLRNLNLLTSSAAYALQMYAKTYNGFTTASDCETTLNSIFTLLRGLNEVKLIRYTHVSASSLFASDLLAIGGLSMIEPLQPSYTVWIGDTVAVELKNLKFNPPLDVYELSVLVIEDGLFDSVASLLDKFNLTSSLNKSRTSVGFTNKFGPVTPQIEPDTEINVYRSDEECRGTPCDRNKQLVSGSLTIILCECLTTASGLLVTSTTPTKPPTPVSPEQPQTFTGTVTKTAEKFSEATSSGAKCLFGSPAKCVPEKRIWMNSVAVIFCLMTFISLLTCALDSKWLAPFALKFTVKSQLKVMGEFAMDAKSSAGSSQLQVVTEGQNDPFAQEPEDRVLFQRSNSSGGGHSATACYKELSSDQTRWVSQALRQIPADPVIDSVLPTMTFSRLSKFQIFILVALTAHPITSILTSRCKLVSRKTNIFVLYVRWVYELGLSMFFNLGLGQDSPNQYAILLVRCLYSVACVTIFAGVIKKFVRYDTLFNLSAVGFCLPKMPVKKPKPAQESVFKVETKDSVHTPVSPAVSVNAVRKKNTQRKNWSNHGSIHKVSPASSVIVEKKFTLDNPQNGVQAAGRTQGKAISTEELPVLDDQTKGMYDPADHKGRNLTFIVLSYLTMYVLLLGSVFVIVAVSQANDDSGQWPFGYWYVCQFIVSSVFGSTLSIFVQFQLLLYRLKILRQPLEKTPWLATRHIFFNGEVHELADLITTTPPNPRKISETQIKSSAPSLEELPRVPEEQRAN